MKCTHKNCDGDFITLGAIILNGKKMVGIRCSKCDATGFFTPFVDNKKE